MNHIVLGNMGETAAIEYLRKFGYEIIDRNFRCKSGEIDIIAKYKKILVFVEVKTRRSKLYGTPSEAVTYAKQQKIINTALYYLQEAGLSNPELRFDVIEILYSHSDIQYNHIINAFGR